MSKKEPFDPFDEKHRDKVKRRKPSEIAFEKKQWEERIDNHFRRSLDDIANGAAEWPTYVQSSVLIYWTQYNTNTNLPERLLRLHTERSMGVLGYHKMENPCSKDGRFKLGEDRFFLYAKSGAPKIGKAEVKQLFAEE